MLKALPGKKVVFSNAPQTYALAVLKLMKIDGLFEDVMTIEHTGYRPKPDSYGFLKLLKKHNVKPAQCVMVEDCLVNLRAAKRLGMNTVWVHPSQKNEACVNVKIRTILQLPNALHRLEVKFG
jgi:putative hydrolase of the HAD superfamily